MRVFAWCSAKGGVGKTSSAINGAVALAKAGSRVLLVDMDPQSNATLVLTEGRGVERPTVAEVLMGDAHALDAIRTTRTPGLSILPASIALADANVALTNAIGRETRLRTALADVDFDLVVIDSSPSRSVLTVNALVAATEVLIPVEPGLFALAGLGDIQTAIDDVKRYLGNPGLRIGGILLTRTRNDRVSRDVEAQLRESFGPLVFKATVPTSVKVEEAHSRFRSVIDYAPTSPGAVAYLAVAEEILHGRQERTRDGADSALPTDRRRGRRAAG